MRSQVVRVAAIVGATILALFLLVPRSTAPRMVIKAYFTNAMGLRDGAAVRLAGVDIGSVKSVHARPELKEAPVEVVMVLSSPDGMKIPNDSTVSLETAGVLGETFVEIDATKASGPPIVANDVLR
jgi:phospholipid/cholesterol/gamma-HCH transport system substrate-binding protein